MKIRATHAGPILTMNY